MSTQSGTVSVHSRGFGFLEWSDDGVRRSAFVPAPALRGFLHGDRVRAKVEKDRKGLAARDLELEQRDRTTLFGTLTKGRKGRWELLPDPEVANRAWSIAGSDLELKEGVHVTADLLDDAVHVRAVVPPEEVELQRIRDRYLIRHPFPAEVLDDAEKRKPRRTAGWRDLRDLTTLTIDAPYSRDLDDALSVQPAGEDGAMRVFVHIADVDSLVEESSPVDEEARKRGTSVYLAGGVTPMLPPSLSEQRLSLLPGQDRRALTAELRVDAEGEVTSIDLYPSTIRSDTRLSYEQVDRFLAGTDPDDIDDDVLDTLSWLRTLSSRIAAVRRARGGVSFDRFETKIELDEAMEPVQITARRQTPANSLIERIMVAANEAVAEWLVARGLPGVFRVHPAPDAQRVGELEASLERMGYSPGLSVPFTPRALSALETQLADAGLQPVLQEILAQVLDRARYTVHPGEHFGLGSTGYVHFTSPIRRYADLTVHRIVKAYLAGDRELDPHAPAVEELSVHLNEAAARAAKAEAARKRTLTARWAAERVGTSFDGHIIAVKPFGLIVHLLGTGVTGAIPKDSLEGDWRHEGHRMVGPDDSWAIGDRIAVVIASVDTERGRIDLAPEASKPRKRNRRRRRRR
jgi:ribonuclease R